VIEEENMTTSFSIGGLQSPTEVAVAWEAVERYRQSRNTLLTENSVDATPQVDGRTAEVAQRIYKGLTWRPLDDRYRAILKILLNASPTVATTIGQLATTAGATRNELRANLSKLSARMKRIANQEESAALRTPFLLLAEIEYDEKNSSRYRLTPAGREAVRTYLNRE
jgi:hypothetical protein